MLTLISDGLLSKFGFNDGDEPDHWLDWCDEQGIDYNARGWDWHTTLRRLVREHLLPRLDQQVELTDIDTIHNPIRALTVDGVEIDWYEDYPDGTLTPDSVEVPYDEVLRIAREVSARGAGCAGLSRWRSSTPPRGATPSRATCPDGGRLATMSTPCGRLRLGSLSRLGMRR